MRKQDIQVGTDYATAAGDWEFRHSSRVERVRVISLDGEIATGWNGRGKTRPGSVVAYIKDDGTPGNRQGTLPNRLIFEEWESYSKRRKAGEDARRIRELDERAARIDRADNLGVIIRALRDAGIANSIFHVYHDETREAIERYYPTLFVAKEDGSRPTAISCPLAGSVVAYVQHGEQFRISAEDLIKVVGG